MIDSVFGSGPQQLEGSGTNSAASNPYPVEVYQSPLLDLTKTVSNVEFVPARKGFFPLAITTSCIVESVSGVQTSPPTLRAGNNVTHDNFIATDTGDPTNAAVNAAVAPAYVGNLISSFVADTVMNFTNSPVLFDITAPAVGTGGYACMARFVTTVIWVATDLF